MRKLRTGSIVAVAVLGLALGACGDDDDDAPTDDTTEQGTDDTTEQGTDDTSDSVDDTSGGSGDEGSGGVPEGQARDMIVDTYTNMGMSEEDANCILDNLDIDFSSIEGPDDLDMGDMMTQAQDAVQECGISADDFNMGGS